MFLWRFLTNSRSVTYLYCQSESPTCELELDSLYTYIYIYLPLAIMADHIKIKITMENSNNVYHVFLSSIVQHVSSIVHYVFHCLQDRK